MPGLKRIKQLSPLAPKTLRQPRLLICLGVPPDLPPRCGLDVVAVVIGQFEQQAFQPLGRCECSPAYGQGRVVELLDLVFCIVAIAAFADLL